MLRAPAKRDAEDRMEGVSVIVPLLQRHRVLLPSVLGVPNFETGSVTVPLHPLVVSEAVLVNTNS